MAGTWTLYNWLFKPPAGPQYDAQFGEGFDKVDGQLHLLTQVQSFYRLRVSNNPAMPDTKVDVTADVITMLDVDNTPYTIRSFAKTADITTIGVNGLDIEMASASPSLSPSLSPSHSPSLSPSASPSLSPSTSPSLSPSVSPSTSISPSTSPSRSFSPSVSPSASLSPSLSPSTSPSVSLSPSASPSVSPSVSISPSKSPSASPSLSPSVSPSPAYDAWYYLYCIGKTDKTGAALLFSASDSAPIMPTGYSFKKLISAIYYTVSTASLATINQLDRWVIYQNLGVLAGTASNGSSYVSKSLVRVVPSIITKMQFLINNAGHSGNDINIYIAWDSSGTNSLTVKWTTGSGFIYTPPFEYLANPDNTQEIYLKGTNTSAYCKAYELDI